MAVTPQQVKELREKTGVGMMACQKALEEAKGDAEKAIEILRKKGEAKADSKSERSTKEGQVAIVGRSLVKLLCETDFVARNEKFQKFAHDLAEECEKTGADGAKKLFEKEKSDKIQAIGENIVLESVEKVEGGKEVGSYVHSNGKFGTIVVLDGGTEDQARDVAMHATAMNPLVANPEEVDQSLIEKEKEIYREQLKNEKKPDAIIEKIMEGKVRKFCADVALSSQSFVKDPSKTVQEYLGAIKIIKFVRYSI